MHITWPVRDRIFMTVSGSQHLLKPILDHLNAGRIPEAIELSNRALEINKSPEILEVLANCYLRIGQSASAIETLSTLLKQRPGNVPAWNNLGALLLQVNRLQEAGACFQKVLQIDMTHPKAVQNMVKVLAGLNRDTEIIPFLNKVLKAKPGHSQALIEKARQLAKKGNHKAALQGYRKAQSKSSKPLLLEGDVGRALLALGRIVEAKTAYETVLKRTPEDLDALLGLAEAHAELGEADKADILQKKVEKLRSKNFDTHHQLSKKAFYSGEYVAAEKHARAALEFEPESEAMRAHYLKVLRRTGRIKDAMAFAELSIGILPESALLYHNLALLLRDAGNKPESIEALERSIELDPTDIKSRSLMMRWLYEVCDWKRAQPHLDAYLRGTEENPDNLFANFVFEPDPKRHFHASKVRAAGFVPSVERHKFKPRPARPDKLHIGFFSSDFSVHPVGLILNRLLKSFDRSRFQISLFENTRIKDDPVNRELRKIADSYHDFRNEPPKRVAEIIRGRNLDIAIDLAGHTVGHRLEWFAYGLAPIHMSWLGYAGTTACEYMDYLIADTFSLPEENTRYITECPILLPGSVLPGRDDFEIGAATTRADHGLSESDFVFASFNNAYKITPSEFDIWMRLLLQIDNSALWLGLRDDRTQAFLLDAANERGVADDRLVFAKRTDQIADHYARLGLADLFLDSFNYNAHSTAMEALWAELPLLTCTGIAMPARIASGILHALDLPELVTDNPGAYEDRALELASDPAKLSRIKAKLAVQKVQTDVFRPSAFAGYLEKAFDLAYQLHLNEEPPSLLRINGQL